jgi:hypothetical protein
VDKGERLTLTAVLGALLAPKLTALGIPADQQPALVAAAAVLVPVVYHHVAEWLARRFPAPKVPAAEGAPVPTTTQQKG